MARDGRSTTAEADGKCPALIRLRALNITILNTVGTYYKYIYIHIYIYILYISDYHMVIPNSWVMFLFKRNIFSNRH